MGAGTIVAMIVVAIISAALSYYLLSKYQPDQQMPELNIMKIEEGNPVPIIYGTVRIAGTLIYYGGVQYIEPESGGGKGGGGKGGGGSGFSYIIDAWIVFGHGNCELLYYLFDEKGIALFDGSLEEGGYDIANAGHIDLARFERGNTGKTIPISLEYASGLPKICWTFLYRYRLGENRSTLHKIEAVLHRTLPTTISHANMTQGSNPAAVIYDIMTDNFYGMSISPTKINMTKFNEAATFWYNEGYALNFGITKRSKFSSLLDIILNWTPCSFYMDEYGQYAIQVFDPDQVEVSTLNENDFVEFAFQRETYASTVNEIRVKWTDPNNYFKERMDAIRNSANARMQGDIITKTIDLLGFNDATAISKRMWEMIKSTSYPPLRIEFTLGLKEASKIYPGSCVVINHTNYGMANVKCRVMEVSTAKISEDKISYVVEQMVEALIDASFTDFIPITPSWEDPEDVEPEDVAYARIFEMPWTTEAGTATTFALLAARAGQEEGAGVMFSSTGVDYTIVQVMQRFAIHATLDEEYSEDTFMIDDDIGFLFTPYGIEIPSNISRENLFLYPRYAIIGDEIMRYQLVEAEGVSSYRVTGVIRGCFNTPVATHAPGDVVWFFTPSTAENDNNILRRDVTSQFWIKFITAAMGWTLPIDEATAYSCTPTNKARQVESVNMIEAVRDGSNNIVVIWFPIARGFATGAGDANESGLYDMPPGSNFEGDFEYRIGAGAATAISACTFTTNYVGAVDISVRQRINGIYSDWETVSVGAAAGTYLNEIGLVDYA